MNLTTLSTARSEDLLREYQGIQGMSEDLLKHEIMLGGRFVCYFPAN
jgi:hypothetical protein